MLPSYQLQKSCIKFNNKLNSLQRCDIAWHSTKLQNYARSGSVFAPTQPHSFSPLLYLKASWKKILIEINLVGMSMIFYFVELHLSRCKSAWLVSMKQYTNFNFHHPAMFRADFWVILPCKIKRTLVGWMSESWTQRDGTKNKELI
jgi:hypothetical protein